MGEGHGHHDIRAGARHRHRLRSALLLVGAFFLVEATAGFLTNSLALLSDAGHLLTDAAGLAMGLAAITVADRHAAGDAPGQRTFGLFRLEILAALANAVLLFAVAAYVLVEAVIRLSDPPKVHTGPMLVVAVIGLGVNLVALRLLHGGADESINVEGAYLEVLADLVASVAAIAAGAIVATTGWRYADPLAGAAVGLFVLPRTWRLAARALRILVEAAPPDVDLGALRSDLEALDGVVDVHDLHVWTLTSDMEMATAHLMVAAGADSHGVLDQARSVLRDRYHVAHATLQVEPDDHRGCDELRW